MPATFTNLGPGTLTIGATGTEEDFSCEVLSAAITHEYEDVGEARTMLCGEVRQASRKRLDGFSASIENDLSGAGMYAYLAALGENPDPVQITYTPNTTAGAKWVLTIVPLMPASIGADEYGAPIASDIEWPGVGLATFTAATGGAAA